jgi:hypothetical protein
MKRLITLICLLLLTYLGANAQTATVTGTVTDVTGKPLPGVGVTIGLNTATTGADGNFSLSGVSYGKAEVTFAMPGFESVSQTIDISSPSQVIPAAQLKVSGAATDQQTEGSITSLDMDDDYKDQYVSGLLHSTNDPFVSISGYTLSAGYFRPRGYDNEYSEVLIQGLVLNDPETGRPNFSDWGGLNDATRFKESSYGLTPTRFSFGSLGGTQDIDVRPSHQRQQTKVSYAFSNRSYQHRAMATYSTGLMKNGWAVTASASTRLAKNGYVKGTPYEAYSYFLAVEKKINDKHFISFTGFGAPIKKGMQSASVQEVYDLLDDHYYNPNWGYQNGEERSARIRTTHEPVLMLSHYWDINKTTKMATSLGYSFGRTGTTALNWYNASDPRPDYYRYLPSYMEDPTIAAQVASAWQNDQTVSQIDWDYLYQVNLLSNLSGEQAKYILEERRLDHNQIGLSSHINKEINNNIFISGGLNIGIYSSHNYKVIKDMLGGDYWIDIDQFAERDFPADTSILQNDLNNPDRKVGEGDKYGYDYNVHINNQSLWGLAEFSYKHIDFYAGLNLSASQFWREGNMKNGRYPENSYGKSDKQSFYNYAVKAGVTYKPTGRHFFVLNTGYFNIAPNFADVFTAPRINNKVVPEINSKRIFSADLSYIIRTPRVTGRLTVFETMFWDDTKVSSFYHDDLQTYVNYVMVGINKVNQGIELGVEVKIIPTLSAVLAGSIGNYRYTSRPTAYVSVENGSVADTSETVYAKYFYVAGTPQTAGSFGLKFQHPKFWYANVNANLFANNWVDFNPARRTSNAIDGLGDGDPVINDIINQTKAFDKAQFTLDVSLGKSFKIKKYYINLNASVSNLLNNKNLVTTSYEQMRFDFETHNVSKFPPKSYYGFGRTFFVMASFRF